MLTLEWSAAAGTTALLRSKTERQSALRLGRTHVKTRKVANGGVESGQVYNTDLAFLAIVVFSVSPLLPPLAPNIFFLFSK